MPGKAKRLFGARQCLECGALLDVTSRNYDKLKYCARPATCRQTAYQRRKDLRKAQRARALAALQEQ